METSTKDIVSSMWESGLGHGGNGGVGDQPDSMCIFSKIS